MKRIFTQIRAGSDWFGLCKKQVVFLTGFLFLLLINPLYSLAQSTVYSTAGSTAFTVPANVTGIRVECWGGGGSGRGVGTIDYGGGGGGGGGAYVRSVIPVTPGAVINLYVAAGGSGAKNAPGTAGESSWFASAATIIAAGGGAGGIANENQAGAGGSAALSIGTIKYKGGDGALGKSLPITNNDGYGAGGGSSAGNGAAGNAPSALTPWFGGIAPAGGGNGGNGPNNGSTPASTGNGGNAPGIGGGGGGGKKAAGNGQFFGGNGHAGQVVVSWPEISGFGSPEGCQGTSIVINGTNLSGATSVTIGGTPAIITSNTNVQIVATIGAGTATGTVTVITDYGTVTSVTDFAVRPAPAVTIVTGAGTYCGSTVISASNGGNGTMYFQGTVSNGTSTTTPASSQTITASGTYYFRALGANGCWGPEGSAAVTINAVPVVDAGGALDAVCQGATTASLGGSFGGGATGAIWSDGLTGPNAGTFTNNDGSTPGITTYTASATAPATVTLTLTNLGGSCGTVYASKTLTVHPLLIAGISGDALVCQDDTPPKITFTASNGTSPYTFSYTVNGGPVQTITTLSGNSIDLAVPMDATGTFTYTLLGIQDAGSSPCFQLQSSSVNIKIKEPVTIINQPEAVNTCITNSASFSVTATGDSLHYQWYKDGAVLSDNDNITGTQTNKLDIEETELSDNGNYYVVVSGSSACSPPVQSLPVSLTVNEEITIDVQPQPQVVCEGGTAVFTVSSGNPGITYKWRRGTVELSDAGNISGVYTPTLTITNASPADAANNYNVMIVSPEGVCGQLKSKNVKLVVNAIPVVNLIDTQAVCNGSSFSAVNFSGPVAGTAFAWTNDNTSIGLDASGSGNLPLFNAVNGTSAPVFAHLMVTPSYTNEGVTCPGVSLPFVITVNPSAAVNASTDRYTCNGGTVSPVHFTSNAIGGDIVYNWVNDNPAIGLAPAGSGDVPSFAGVNYGTSPAKATIIVTPSYTNVLTTCVGISDTFNITVNPSPKVNAIDNQDLCNGASAEAVNFSSTATGGTLAYSWTNSNPSIGLQASGTGDIPVFTAVNTGPVPVTAVIRVTASFTNGGSTCFGPEQEFEITVYPVVTVAATPAAPLICSGENTNIVLSGNVEGTSFSWTVLSQTNVTGAAAGSGNLINQVLTATGLSNGTVIYEVTPLANGCSSTPLQITVNVKPPVTITPLVQAVCNGSSIAPITLTGIPAGSIISWTRDNPAGISSTIGTSGSGSVNGSFTNSNTTAATVTFLVTAKADNGCEITRTVTVKVFADMSPVTINTSQIVCTGQSATPLTSSAAKGGSDLGYSYQWQQADTSTGPWTPITGANASSFLPPTEAMYYQLTVSNSCGDVTSNYVQIETAENLNASTFTGTELPVTICDGESFHYHVKSLDFQASLLKSRYIKFTWQSAEEGYFTSDTTNPFGVTVNGVLIKRFVADADFTVHNSSNTPVSKDLYVTPIIYKADGGVYCALNPRVTTMIINPVPVISAAAGTTCSGTPFSIAPANGIPGSNVVPADTKYSWDAPVVTGGMTGGIAQAGQTSIAATLVNPTSTVQKAVYTVTPATDPGCSGNSFEVTVNVNPKPLIPNQALTVCTGNTFSYAPVNDESATIVPAGTIYKWTKPTGPGVTGGLAGTGASITGKLSTTSLVPVTATCTVTPTAGDDVGGCTGEPFTFTITVNPKATASISTAPAVVCYNTDTVIKFTGTPNTIVSYNKNGMPAGTVSLDASGWGTLQTGSLTENTTYTLTGINYPAPGPSCMQLLNSSVSIIVNAVAGATISEGPSPICQGDVSWIDFSGTPNTVVTYYNGVSNQTVTLNSAGSARVPVSPASTTTYTLLNVAYPGAPFCSQAISGSTIIAVEPKAQWFGYNSNWNDPVNWCGGVPDGTTDVIIPATGPGSPYYMPGLTADGAARNLDIAPSMRINLNGHVFTLNGTLSGTGTFTGSPTSGLIIGSTAGTLRFTPNNFPLAPTNNYLKTLELKASSSATLGDSLNIAAGNSGSGYGTVTANGTLNANNLLRLRSDASGTSRIGASNGTITGEVTVERYFPARRAWRFIGLPFSSSSQSINQAWQEGYTDVVLQCPPQYTGTPGFGTAIAYNNAPGSGYDIHNNNYKPSLQVYQNSMWVTPLSTLTNLVTTSPSAFPAYSLFVRGDRTVCLTNTNDSNTTTLRPRGVLNQFGGAPVSRNLGGAPNDYILIGNPYASSVDIRNIVATASGIYTDMFWAWNPALGGADGTGGYEAISLPSGIFVPNHPSYTAGTTVQGSQAFIVRRNNASSSFLSFNEADKIGTDLPGGVFGIRATKLKPPAIFVNLMDISGALVDGVGAVFGNKYSSEADSEDIPKKWNEEIENMALVRNGKTLSIELRPVPAARKDTLFFRLYLKQKPYRLQVFTQNLPINITGKGWIIDKYLGSKTEINLYDTVFYDFVPNTDTNSYRNRFILVFNSTDASSIRGKNDTGLIADNKNSITVSPNPVNDSKVMLKFKNIDKGEYEVTIYSPEGKRLFGRKLHHNGGTNIYPLQLNATWVSGLYKLTVINEKSKVEMNLQLLIVR